MKSKRTKHFVLKQSKNHSLHICIFVSHKHKETKLTTNTLSKHYRVTDIMQNI